MVSAGTPDADLLDGLRRGERDAFAALVDRYSPSMLRVARAYVSDAGTAEDVVQETWIAVIRGIGGFEGRSSLKTWIFTILRNIAKTRGVRDRREEEAVIAAAATVDSARFDGRSGAWKQPPPRFGDSPEDALLSGEFVSMVRRYVDALPTGQRLVVTLRDILGFDAAEVCEHLQITPANQRVLLHRGRAAIRAAMEVDVMDGSLRRISSAE